MPVSDASPIPALDVLLNRLQLAPTPTTRQFTGKDWRRAIAQRRAATLAAALACRAESADRARLHPHQAISSRSTSGGDPR